MQVLLLLNSSITTLLALFKLDLFSFTCNNGFTYGFDVRSFYMLFKTGKNGKNVKNPYTRETLSKECIQSFKRFVRYGKCLKYNVILKDEEECLDNTTQLDPYEEFEMNIRELFFKIDEFGYITDFNWVISLSINGIKRFMRELFDIWNYRLDLQNDKKRMIVHPSGRPFGFMNIQDLNNLSDIDIMKHTYAILKRFICNGIDDAHRNLGSMYVLTALTTVSPHAAEAFPWLYESVSTEL